MGIILIIYLILHSPAIVMFIIGLNRLKTSPKSGKILMIIASIYFIIGTGVCGLILF